MPSPQHETLVEMFRHRPDGGPDDQRRSAAVPERFVRRHYGRGWAEGEAKGEARGHAEAVLEVLDAREIPVGDDARRRITECQDTAQLTAWLRRAVVATSADELFA